MYDLSQIKLDYRFETIVRLTDISDEEYFGGTYKGYLSNSQLKLINPDEGGSPTKFISGFKDQKHSDALELGTAVHRMVLERDKYYVSDVVKPSGKIGDVCDTYHRLLQEGVEDKEALVKACQENNYYNTSLTEKRMEGVLTAGKDYLEHLSSAAACESCIILNSEMKERLDNCLTSVKNNQLITSLLNPVDPELGFPTALTFNEDVLVMKVKATMPSLKEDVFSDEEVELDLKVKIDNWTIDVENKILTLNDLKTTGGSIAAFAGQRVGSMYQGEEYIRRLDGSFQKFRYYRQMAMYAKMLRAYAEEKYGMDDTWTFNVNMLVVETSAPHLSHAFSVTGEWLLKGEYEMNQLVKRVAFHTLNGWSTFTDVDLTKITAI